MQKLYYEKETSIHWGPEFTAFLPARRYAMSKRRKLASWFLHHLVAPRLVFWRQIWSPNSKGFPPNGSLKEGSVGKIQRFSSCKRQYLEYGVLISRIVTEPTLLYYSFLPARRYASAGYRDRNVSVRPSVCPSVRLSVRHAPVLCQNEESYRHDFFTIW